MVQRRFARVAAPVVTKNTFIDYAAEQTQKRLQSAPASLRRHSSASDATSSSTSSETSWDWQRAASASPEPWATQSLQSHMVEDDVEDHQQTVSARAEGVQTQPASTQPWLGRSDNQAVRANREISRGNRARWSRRQRQGRGGHASSSSSMSARSPLRALGAQGPEPTRLRLEYVVDSLPGRGGIGFVSSAPTTTPSPLWYAAPTRTVPQDPSRQRLQLDDLIRTLQ